MKSIRSSLALRRAFGFAACVASAAVMTGCGITETINERGKIDYKSATKTAGTSLEVPPDLTNPRSDERFGIPAGAEPRTFSGYQRGQQAAPRAPTEHNVLPKVAGARIERAGDQRWLVIDRPAEEVWPVVRDFWQESGFVIQTELPSAGVMETDWAENRAKIPTDIIRSTIGKVFDNLYSTSERDKFRTRLERTGTATEVYISHRGMEEVYTTQSRDQTVWQPRAVDPGLEAEFLNRLMLKFAPQAPEAARAGTAASTGSGGQRAQLIKGAEGSRVEIAEGFDRAWRSVGLALDRGGFTVEDRDRSKGVYFVRYIDPEIEALSGGRPGLLSRIFSSGDRPPASSRQYQVQVAARGEQSVVTALTRDGQPVTSEADVKIVARMMTLLHEQLKL